MIRPVRRVQVQDDVRIPVGEELDERARLGGLELHEIAIEVEAVGVFARADARERPELRGPVIEADALVAVRVIEGRDEDDHPGEQRTQIADREAPRDDERGFFPSTSPA